MDLSQVLLPKNLNFHGFRLHHRRSSMLPKLLYNRHQLLYQLILRIRKGFLQCFFPIIGFQNCPILQSKYHFLQDFHQRRHRKKLSPHNHIGTI